MMSRRERMALKPTKRDTANAVNDEPAVPRPQQQYHTDQLENQMSRELKRRVELGTKHAPWSQLPRGSPRVRAEGLDRSQPVLQMGHVLDCTSFPRMRFLIDPTFMVTGGVGAALNR